MKNLTIFRSEKGWKPNFELLNNNLSIPGKLGYAWMVLRDNDPFISVGSNHLITCEKQEKLLPAQVIDKELKARIDQIKKDQGYRVGKKQKRDLKEQIIEELYVKAFTVSKLVNVWINTEHDLLCIETTSTAAREQLAMMNSDTEAAPSEEKIEAIKNKIALLRASRDQAQKTLAKINDDIRLAAEAEAKTKKAAEYHDDAQAWNAIAEALAPDGIAKTAATEFYRHWHNAPGTNTDQGFDDWWMANRARILYKDQSCAE